MVEILKLSLLYRSYEKLMENICDQGIIYLSRRLNVYHIADFETLNFIGETIIQILVSYNIRSLSFEFIVFFS